MSNYPAGVYDCIRCGKVAFNGHECLEVSFRNYEVFYSKDGGIKWYLCEEHSNEDRALQVAEELVEDGFESQVIDDGNNIIFNSLDNREVA